MGNSRPVMLEPYLWRLETGVVQGRPVTRRELRCGVPPEHLAYGRQLACRTVALACRWLLAGSAIQHGAVCLDDWNKANALCNPNPAAAGVRDHEVPEESLSPRLHNLYDGLDVWVASPYGQAGPYKLCHVGVQGDKQGVGYFLEKRTEYLRHAVRGACTPRTGDLARQTRRPMSRGSLPPPTASFPRLRAATTAATSPSRVRALPG